MGNINRIACEPEGNFFYYNNRLFYIKDIKNPIKDHEII